MRLRFAPSGFGAGLHAALGTVLIFFANLAASAAEPCAAPSGDPLATSEPAGQTPAQHQAFVDRRKLIKQLSEMGVKFSNVQGANHLDVRIDHPEATDDWLRQLEPLQDQVRRLSLAHSKFTPACYDTIGRFTALKQLTISDQALDDTALSKLAHLPRLSGLQIDDCSRIDDQALRQFESFPALCNLNLAGPADQITDVGLKLLSSLPWLDTLSVSSDKITDEGLGQLAQSKSLSLLSLHGRSFGAAGLERLKAAHLLRDLRLSGCPQLGDEALEVIGGMTRLRYLRIKGGQMADAGLAPLNRLVHLRYLVLEDVPLTGAGLAALTELMEIYQLTVTGPNVSNVVFAHFHQFPTAQILELGAGKPTDQPTITGEGLKLIGSASKLNQLVLVGTEISEDDLPPLAALPHFFCVHSRFNPGIKHSQWMPAPRDAGASAHRWAPGAESDSDKVVAQLRKMGATCYDFQLPICSEMPSLSRYPGRFEPDRVEPARRHGDGRFKVAIKGPAATDETLTTLTKLVNVVELKVEGDQFTAAGVDAIGDLSYLEVLSMRGVAVSASGLAKISRLAGLKTLELDDCSLTDEALEALAGFSALRELAIGGPSNQITSAGIKRLAGCKLLRKLRLGHLADDSLSDLIAGPMLTELIITNQTIDRAALRSVAEIKNLRWLNLEEINLIPGALEELATAKRLRVLWIVDCPQLDNNVIAEVSRLSQLNGVKFAGDAITGDALTPLNGMIDLTELSLEGPRLTGQGLVALTALDDLRHLSLRGESVSNEVFAHLGQFPSLSSLTLDCSNSESSRITDDGLKMITGAGKLNDVHLIATRVSEDGLAVLANLPRLAVVTTSLHFGGASKTWWP